MKDLPHGQTQYDLNEKETFEAMALRVAKQSKLNEIMWLDEKIETFMDEVVAVTDFATRIRDELCKEQEPVACVDTRTEQSDYTTLQTDDLYLSNYEPLGENGLVLGAQLYLHPAPIPADMVMVPREPTERQWEEGKIMLQAMIDCGTSLDIGLVYKAMIAAYEKEQSDAKS